MTGVLTMTQEWGDALREYCNTDPLHEQEMQGLTLKLWWVNCDWHGRDVLITLEWVAGIMTQLKIEDTSMAPNKDWRRLKFDRTGFWGGFTTNCQGAFDTFHPQPGYSNPSEAKPTMTLLKALSDPRIRLDQSALEAYKVMDQLQGWLNLMTRGHATIEVDEPGYTPKASGPVEPVWPL